MKKRNIPKISAVILGVLICVFIGVLINKLKENYDPEVFSEDYISIDEVKQELAFTVYSKDEWDDWFSGRKQEYLTQSVLDELLKKLGVSEQIDFVVKRKNSAIPRTEWNQIYEQILGFLDMEQSVTKESMLVLNSLELDDQTVLVTNQGDYYTRLQNTYFTNWMAYEIYIRENQCIGIAQVSRQGQTVENVYLKSCQREQICFLFAGAVYEIELNDNQISCEPGVCDLVFTDGTLTAIKTKQDFIQGQMLSYDDSEIEIEDYGRIHHNGKLPVYQTYGDVSEKSISDVVLGNMDVAYVTAGKEVCAILILQPADIKNIRVLLLADDGTNVRKDIYLKCSAKAVVTCGDETKNTEPDELLHPADALADTSGKTYVLKPETEDGRIYLCDQDGTATSNGYFGTIEVRNTENGYTVVNELPLEEYLSAVVPSEMPSNFSAEALKAQAVCARSYAYIQLMRADLAAYGAHINDSTSYQVYNKVEQTKESVAAVDATCDQVMTWMGKVVEAYYFSTSMGYTDTAEIWNVDDPADYGYLKKTCLNQTDDGMDLSDETTFTRYIKGNADGYDSDIRYYRWSATADLSDKTEQVNEILSARHSISPQNVLYYESDGTTEMDVSDAGKKMGDITGMSVEARSGSGSILTLNLTYEHGVVKVKTEYNIRKILGCMIEKIVYADATESENMTMLPSAFSTIEKQEDGTYLLSGGGYGHGLGMSQNGANGMAKAGMNYLDILNYFYQDIKIETIGEMEGKKTL